MEIMTDELNAPRDVRHIRKSFDHPSFTKYKCPICKQDSIKFDDATVLRCLCGCVMEEVKE